MRDALGRGYYENVAEPGRGYRNGYRRGQLRTAEGAIEYGVPQVADRTKPFVSRVRVGGAGRTAELEQLAVEMYARGLSTRGIEGAFRDATGASVLSRAAVSEVTARLWQDAFGERAVLELRFAAVIRAADRWRGIQVGEFEQRKLRALRDELNRAHAQRVAPRATRATPPVVQKSRK